MKLPGVYVVGCNKLLIGLNFVSSRQDVFKHVLLYSSLQNSQQIISNFFRQCHIIYSKTLQIMRDMNTLKAFRILNLIQNFFRGMGIIV